MFGRIVFGLLAFITGLFTLGGLGQTVSGDSEVSMGTNVGMLIFFGGLTLLFGWLTFRKRPQKSDSPAPIYTPPVAPKPGEVLTASGAGGKVVFDGREIRISRSGGLSFLIHGLAGEKSIMLSAIQAVQLRPAKGGVRGYLQLTVLGGVEARGGTFNAAGDENSVLFDTKDQASFERMAVAIKNAIHERSTPQIASTPGVAEELGRFADLRDRGVVTEEEFAAKKAELLSRTN